jgi:putative flippase GtrA
MTKRDFLCVTTIGAEVGLLFQPIIWNLWPDISTGLANVLGSAPPQATVQLAAFVGFTVLAPLALLILSLLAKFIPIFFQIGKFAAVGSSNSFVDIGLLNLVIMSFGVEKGTTAFLIAATATAFAGTVNSFFWNKFWTFEAGTTEGGMKKALAEVVKFYAVTGVAALVNGAATYAAANAIVGVSPELAANIAKVVGIFSGMTLNFLGYKFIVFKKPVAAPASAPTPPPPPKML